MIEEQRSTTTPSDADNHSKLMAEAQASDLNEELDSLETSQSSATKGGEGEQESGKRTPDPSAKQDKDRSPETPTENIDAQGRKRGPDGKFLPKGEEQPPEQQQPQQEAQGSKYERAKKDAERLDRSWKALEAEKETTRREQAELKQRLDAIERSSQQRPQEQRQNGFRSQDYAKGAAEFDRRAQALIEEGDVDAANEQLRLAESARALAHQYGQAEAQEAQQAEHGKFRQAWESVANEVIRDHPELKDPASEPGQALLSVFKEFPFLRQLPEGFRHGHDLLELRRNAAEVSGLREDNQKLKAELERRDRLNSPEGGKSAAGHPGAQKASDMNLKDLHKKLAREAELADLAA